MRRGPVGLIALVVLPFFGFPPGPADGQLTGGGSRRAIRKEVTVAATLDEVWEAWTTDDGLTSFMAPIANVEMVPLGPYEITFDPLDDRQGTKGLKLLAFLPKEFLAFQWNASPDYPTVRANPGWVVVQFEDLPSGGVWVVLTHLGWREGQEWDEAFLWLSGAWDEVMTRLEERFRSGPIDGAAPYPVGAWCHRQERGDQQGRWPTSSPTNSQGSLNKASRSFPMR